jgi:hypothetical protein
LGVSRKALALTTKVHKKPTHTGHFLNSASSHPPHVKTEVEQSLYSRAATICQDKQGRLQETDNLEWYLLLCGYTQQFINLALQVQTRQVIKNR